VWGGKRILHFKCADNGEVHDDDEDENDEDDEDDDENGDDDPLPAGNLLSGGAGFPTFLVPAYSFLKQEQLQLAQLAFVTTKV